MEINFKDEVIKRKDQILSDLKGLLTINTELKDFDENRKYPFGENLHQALEYVLELARKDGFITKNIDEYIGEITYGDQSDFFATIGHIDVVPATGDWKYPPYSCTIADGNIYSRGVVDDKGPTIAIYYAIKILKELGVPLSKRIKLLISLDEETGMRDVRYYLKKNPEQPSVGFIADAEFPLIFAEKGMRPTKFTYNGEIPGFISIKGGIRMNMVPDKLEAIYKLSEDKQTALKEKKFIEKKFKEYSKIEHLEKLEFNLIPEGLAITLYGESAHGSLPEKGVNAVTWLFKCLSTFKQYKTNKLVSLIANVFHKDYFGEKSGIAHDDSEMGKVSQNLSPFKYENGVAEFCLDIRYPNGTDSSKIDAAMTKLAKKYSSQSVGLGDTKIHYVDPKGELVTKLMSIYQKHTNDYTSQPMSIGGGTFAKVLNNCVAFGPQLPDKDALIHQANEFTSIEDFLLSIAIYTNAVYELCK